MTVKELGIRARAACAALATASAGQKNKALLGIADALLAGEREIAAANKIDLANGRENGLTDALMDRLELTHVRIAGMAQGIREIAGQKDPVGAVVSGGVHANGMKITKVRVPLGVIGIIFESRPNVTADAAGLCLKAGNTVILRGGKEAIHSNRAITKIMRGAIAAAGLPADCVQLVEDTSRQSAAELMQLSGYLDVLIPRGGAGLIRAVVENARVPVIETGAGVCHVYADRAADLRMAADIIYNAKTARPSVCNAVETALVHRDIAAEFLPLLKETLDRKNVELRGCGQTLQILPGIKAATQDDWSTEYGDYILSVRVVADIDQAIAHIGEYGTGHSECIVTDSYADAQKFTDRVDCAAVYVNASTYFTDGGVFGLGAEIGISTQKLHTRGPMGVEQLTSVKFVINGSGQVR